MKNVIISTGTDPPIFMGTDQPNIENPLKMDAKASI